MLRLIGIIVVLLLTGCSSTGLSDTERDAARRAKNEQQYADILSRSEESIAAIVETIRALDWESPEHEARYIEETIRVQRQIAQTTLRIARENNGDIAPPGYAPNPHPVTFIPTATYDPSAATPLNSATSSNNPIWPAPSSGACNLIGEAVFCSDGSTAMQIGDATFFSDGTVARDIGGATFYSDGVITRDIGGATFSSDGTVARRIGDATFFSDGTVCRYIGETLFCN